MSQLPRAERVVVSGAKIRDYLLHAAHPRNLGKAAFFERFGFGRIDFAVLADALRQHPIRNPVVKIVPGEWGTRYVVRCSLPSPDGRDPCIQSIWIVEAADPPRLVTAYPWAPGAAA